MTNPSKSGRSFDLVDDKLFEADFFLEKLAGSGFNFFEVRYYFSAFVAAARSVTFSLQAVMADVDGFKGWYTKKQEDLKKNNTSRFFQRIRTESQHIGLTPLNSGTSRLGKDGQPIVRYFFSEGIGEHIPDAPQTDAVTACHQYFTLLLRIIFECYEEFGSIIDPDQYYTLKNLKRLGLSIEDVEEELGFPRGWTKVDDTSDHNRLNALKLSIPRSAIDKLFEKYLKTTIGSKEIKQEEK